MSFLIESSHLSKATSILESDANFDKAHATSFINEAKIDLKSTFNDGNVKWKPQSKWKEGTVLDLSGDNSATYLYRQISVSKPLTIKLSLGSDDSIQVWLNGKKVLGNQNLFKP